MTDELGNPGPENRALTRAASLRALGRTREPSAFRELVRALADPVALVRVAAAQGFGFLGDRAAVAHLERVLLGDVHPSVRWDAAEALGALGSPEALPALSKALAEADERVRRAAAGALSDLGGAPAVALLRSLAATDPSDVVRAKARLALERARPQEGEEPRSRF